MAIEVKDAHKTVEITAPDIVHADSATVLELLQALEEFGKALPLASFLVEQKASPTTDYRYEWTTKDGRTWKQVLRVVVSQDPMGFSMTFNVSSHFTLAEFVAHRAVRDKTQSLIAKGASKIEGEWF